MNFPWDGDFSTLPDYAGRHVIPKGRSCIFLPYAWGMRCSIGAGMISKTKSSSCSTVSHSTVLPLPLILAYCVSKFLLWSSYTGLLYDNVASDYAALPEDQASTSTVNHMFPSPLTACVLYQ